MPQTMNGNFKQLSNGQISAENNWWLHTSIVYQCFDHFRTHLVQLAVRQLSQEYPHKHKKGKYFPSLLTTWGILLKADAVV